MKTFTDWEVTKAVEYVKSHDIESVAEMLLFVLGFKYNLCGTKYLKQGIVIRYGEENSLCKDLYNKIALHFAQRRAEWSEASGTAFASATRQVILRKSTIFFVVMCLTKTTLPQTVSLFRRFAHGYIWKSCVRKGSCLRMRLVKSSCDVFAFASYTKSCQSRFFVVQSAKTQRT